MIALRLNLSAVSAVLVVLVAVLVVLVAVLIAVLVAVLIAVLVVVLVGSILIVHIAFTCSILFDPWPW